MPRRSQVLVAAVAAAAAAGGAAVAAAGGVAARVAGRAARFLADVTGARHARAHTGRGVVGRLAQAVAAALDGELGLADELVPRVADAAVLLRVLIAVADTREHEHALE